MRSLLVAALALLAPLAAAQEEPSVNESDFDASEPAADDAFLDDSQDLAGTGAEGADASGSPDANRSFLPAPALALGLAGVAAVAVALKRR